MKAYIIPIHNFDSVSLVGFALSVRKKVLFDSDILMHFPSDATGVEIKKAAAEIGFTNVKWSETPVEV